MILTTIAESHPWIRRRGCKKVWLRKLHDNRILWIAISIMPVTRYILLYMLILRAEKLLAPGISMFFHGRVSAIPWWVTKKTPEKLPVCLHNITHPAFYSLCFHAWKISDGYKIKRYFSEMILQRDAIKRALINEMCIFLSLKNL